MMDHFDWSQECTLLVHKVSQTQIEQFVWHEFFIQHLLFKAEISTSFGILIELKLTFFGKVQKVHRTLTNPFYNLEISIWVKISQANPESDVIFCPILKKSQYRSQKTWF